VEHATNDGGPSPGLVRCGFPAKRRDKINFGVLQTLGGRPPLLGGRGTVEAGSGDKGSDPTTAEWIGFFHGASRVWSGRVRLFETMWPTARTNRISRDPRPVLLIDMPRRACSETRRPANCARAYSCWSKPRQIPPRPPGTLDRKMTTKRAVPWSALLHIAQSARPGAVRVLLQPRSAMVTRIGAACRQRRAFTVQPRATDMGIWGAAGVGPLSRRDPIHNHDGAIGEFNSSDSGSVLVGNRTAGAGRLFGTPAGVSETRRSRQGPPRTPAGPGMRDL